MVTPPRLVKTISAATGLPLATVVDLDRRLLAAGLRTKGGRGRNAPCVTALDAALTAAGVPHEGHIYKNANHGFHNDTTPRYDEAAAKEAWQHTLDWFNKYVKA